MLQKWKQFKKLFKIINKPLVCFKRCVKEGKKTALKKIKCGIVRFLFYLTLFFSPYKSNDDDDNNNEATQNAREQFMHKSGDAVIRWLSFGKNFDGVMKNQLCVCCLLFASISLESLTTTTTTTTKRLHRHENYHTENSRHGKLRASAFGRSWAHSNNVWLTNRIQPWLHPNRNFWCTCFSVSKHVLLIRFQDEKKITCFFAHDKEK